MPSKDKIHTALYGSHERKASCKLQMAIATVIILNIFALVLETEEQIGVIYKKAFNIFELFSVLVFSIEYLVRFWVSDLTPKPQTPNPKLQTPNPKPQTPNPKPQTPNPKRWTYSLFSFADGAD